jgi:hypothetical protein
MAADQATAAPGCIVCGAPANTIRDNRHYCGAHTEKHLPEVPHDRCIIKFCGNPATIGRYCFGHAPSAA